MEININDIVTRSYLCPLRHLAQPPDRLYIRGTLPPKRRPTVAIIGSRRPTPYGKQVTRELAEKLARQGVIVVSGLAFGIDAVAHHAAIAAGGTTIAVLGSGLDVVYPASHQGLADQVVASGGALLSEYPPGVTARKHHFLARNRLVSGIADAVIVTEAGERSGTLSTVTHALDQNKEVFAVPGQITSPQSIGPNRLIQQGAAPALSADDVLEVIAPALLTAPSHPKGQSPLETAILRSIRAGICEQEHLQRATNASGSEFLTALTLLEIAGQVQRLPGGLWGLTSH